MTAKIAGVFVDLSNLYYCVKKKYPERKVDYEKYLALVKEQYSIFRAFAYGKIIVNNNSDNSIDLIDNTPFINCLKYYGYEPKFKPMHIYSNWDVGLTLDIMRIIEKLDVVIIGSSSRELSCLHEFTKAHGVQMNVLACSIPNELKRNCDSWKEIDESLLEEKEHAKTTITTE